MANYGLLALFEFIELPFVLFEFVVLPFVLFDMFELFMFDMLALVFILLALALVLVFVAVSPQAAPKAATAKTAERAKVFFILKVISCLLKDIVF